MSAIKFALTSSQDKDLEECSRKEAEVEEEQDQEEDDGKHWGRISVHQMFAMLEMQETIVRQTQQSIKNVMYYVECRMSPLRHVVVADIRIHYM